MKISTLFLFSCFALSNCSSSKESINPTDTLQINVDMGTTSDAKDTSDVTDVKDLGEDISLDFDPRRTCYTEVVSLGEVEDDKINEISGIAISRTQNVIWVHNDSGDEDGQFYALDFQGKLVGTFVLEGAKSKDWEDLGIVESEGKTYLYFADTGDNKARSGTGGRSKVRVYRVEEPLVDLSANTDVAQILPDYERYTFTYPEGARDCESLLVDPRTMDLYLLEKKNTGDVHFFRAPSPVDGTNTELEQLTSIPIGNDSYPGAATTASSISADGHWIIVKTYTSVLLFPWFGGDFSAAVSTAPIVLPVPREIQGESIDFGNIGEGEGILTISEGKNPSLNFMKDNCK